MTLPNESSSYMSGQVADLVEAISLSCKDDDLKKINELAGLLLSGFKNGKKVAFFGNGGSAAEAMHLAAEFTGKCLIEHPPLPALCLNESQSALTAIVNDFGPEHIFTRPVQALLSAGDILIGLSTSGKSLNVINALNMAHDMGVKTYLWTGKNAGGIVNAEIWRVNSESTPRIQEIHLLWGHLLAEIVERKYMGLID